ncbi:hypothetical protein KC939_02605 [Candidatus Saccharibacteria bacterium]|nr:hypothetical protein [Candidatus Saccharibacteria bacterium]
MKFRNSQYNITENGSASIFIVIFFTLLIGVITVSFVNIVNQDQQQALNNDLSQSAYDAAKAGVADANRAIIFCESQPNPSGCLARFNNSCEDVQEFASDLNLRTSEGVAVKVGKDAEDDRLNQSYTCAKVQYKTPNVTVKINNQKMRVVRLQSDQAFNVLRFQWFDSEDAKVNAGSSLTLPRTELRSDAKFAKSTADWGGASVPPVLRLQVVYGEANGSFDLNSLKNNSRTTFLYPNDTTAGTTPTSLILHGGRNDIKIDQPAKVKCDNNKFIEGQLACDVSMFAPTSIQPNQKAYLIISPIYNEATVKVEALNIVSLSDPAVPVTLEGYPTIDVTGRAGDVFRRVKTTLDLHGRDDATDNDLPGFDSTQDICKHFGVTGSEHIKSELCE